MEGLGGAEGIKGGEGGGSARSRARNTKLGGSSVDMPEPQKPGRRARPIRASQGSAGLTPPPGPGFKLPTSSHRQPASDGKTSAKVQRGSFRACFHVLGSESAAVGWGRGRVKGQRSVEGGFRLLRINAAAKTGKEVTESASSWCYLGAGPERVSSWWEGPRGLFSAFFLATLFIIVDAKIIIIVS